MSNIRYKTRTNSSPQGKARVYMCCHPKDLPVYFDEMAKEILSRYNCVFCYEEEPDQEYDEDTLFTDLGRMQLFLVPVTKNFQFSIAIVSDIRYNSTDNRVAMRFFQP